MNYSVDWEDDALATLAVIWTGTPNRQAVTAAQTEIDRLLASNPLAHGRPSSEGLYAITVPPLHAQYEILDANRSVKVVSVSELA